MCPEIETPHLSSVIANYHMSAPCPSAPLLHISDCSSYNAQGPKPEAEGGFASTDRHVCRHLHMQDRGCDETYVYSACPCNDHT